jgi:hypothetical protein
MAAISKAVAHRRAQVGALTRAVRAGERPPADLDNAKQDLAYIKLFEHAARVVSNWPAPTDEQLQKVAAILRGGASPPTPSPQPVSGGSTAPSKNRKTVVAERIAEMGGGGNDA